MLLACLLLACQKEDGITPGTGFENLYTTRMIRTIPFSTNGMNCIPLMGFRSFLTIPSEKCL